MYHSYSSHSNLKVLQQHHLQHTQKFEPSADLQARDQAEGMDGGTPIMSGMYMAADYTLGRPETVVLGRMIGMQEPSHPTTPYATPSIPSPESPILDLVTVSSSNINRNSVINACYGSAAAPFPRRLTTTLYAGSNSLNVWQQQQRTIPHNITQAPISGDYFAGAKESGSPLTLGTFFDTNGDSRTVTVHWLRSDSIWAQAQVLVTDKIHNSMAPLWPTDLWLEIDPVGISTIDIQKWIYMNRVPVSRIKCASGQDISDFIDLVESLRKCGGYATAGWEDQGNYQSRLLFVPLFMDLLCAAIPVNGIPKSSEPQSQDLDADGVFNDVDTFNRMRA